LMDIKVPKKSWPQYPSKFSSPPPNLSFKELCSDYPNHLDGELLVEMSDAGLKPRDIVEMMSADTRNPNLRTEWSWVTKRTKKAKLARGQHHRQEAASQVTSVKVERASQSTGQGVLVKVEDSSCPISQAATPVTIAKPVHQTASPIAENQPTSLSSVVSTSTSTPTPTPTPDHLGGKTTATFPTPQAPRSGSSSSVPPVVAPTQLSWQVPQTIMTHNHRSRATATSGVPAATPTPIDRTTTTRTIITQGNQFLFQPSPPKTTPASQYTAEYRHKEALREEIRKHLKLLVDISSTDEGFISRSQQQQQNDLLLQWKKWCDDQSYSLGKQHGVFVGPTLTGFVIMDSLTRLLGALTMINMKECGSCHAMSEERARSQALEYVEALFKRYTSDLQLRANQLFPRTGPVVTPPAPSISVAAPKAANDAKATGNRYGYYRVELSSAAMNLSQQSAEDAVDRTTDEQPSRPADPSAVGPSAVASPAAPSFPAVHDHQQISVPQASHPCFSCQDRKKGCDRTLPACGNCWRSDKQCYYFRG
jgi:Fungal Zn(2)-Cys(6) binuclear cluster domain